MELNVAYSGGGFRSQVLFKRLYEVLHREPAIKAFLKDPDDFERYYNYQYLHQRQGKKYSFLHRSPDFTGNYSVPDKNRKEALAQSIVYGCSLNPEYKEEANFGVPSLSPPSN